MFGRSFLRYLFRNFEDSEEDDRKRDTGDGSYFLGEQVDRA